MLYSITAINQMTQAEFVTVFGGVFEETPTIASRVWNHHPFQDFEHLYQQMKAEVLALTEAEQVDLICAHPDLGSKAKMAENSVKEQAGVGLDRLSPDEFERFHALNQAYQKKFGFPFIIAVRNHTKTSILEAFQRRLQNAQIQEQQTAIAEITQIARFRLQDLVLD